MFAMDQAVANAVAQTQGLTASFVVHDSSRDASDDDDDLTGRAQQRYFIKLAAQCDIFMGFPVEADHLLLPEGMNATVPYALTGFVAASQAAAPATLSTLPASGHVGVLTMTPVATYFDASTVSREHVYDTNDQLYGALKSGEVESALIWQPWLDQQLAQHPQKLHVAALNMPHAVWNIVALYPQTAQNKPEVKAFNTALRGLAADGQLQRIVQPYSIPETEH
jgi:hypothetical protein